MSRRRVPEVEKLIEGQYVDEAGRGVVVLVRPDQPVDYSQVKGIVQGGHVVAVMQGTPEVYSTWYRAIGEGDRMVCESSDLDEIYHMTQGEQVTVQKKESYLVHGEWEDVRGSN